MLENDRVANALQTVLNQVRVQVPVATLIEILSVDFGNHKFNIELSAELIRLAQLKDCLLQVMIAGQNGNNYINARVNLLLK